MSDELPPLIRWAVPFADLRKMASDALEKTK